MPELLLTSCDVIQNQASVFDLVNHFPVLLDFLGAVLTGSSELDPECEADLYVESVMVPNATKFNVLGLCTASPSCVRAIVTGAQGIPLVGKYAGLQIVAPATIINYMKKHFMFHVLLITIMKNTFIFH